MNVHRIKQDFIFSLGAAKRRNLIIPLKYLFFTLPAERTGLLWKILLNGALGLTTINLKYE